MTVAEFTEWLKTQDQGATVKVVVRVPAIGWEGDSVKIVDFVPDGSLHWYVERLEGKSTLLLGED